MSKKSAFSARHYLCDFVRSRPAYVFHGGSGVHGRPEIFHGEGGKILEQLLGIIPFRQAG